MSFCPNVAIDLVEAFIEIDEHCSDRGICTKVCTMGALEVKDEE